MGRPNDGDVFVYIDDNYKTETFINQPYAKQYYKKLNEAYHVGFAIQAVVRIYSAALKL